MKVYGEGEVCVGIEQLLGSKYLSGLVQKVGLRLSSETYTRTL